MILPQNTQILDEENNLALATKEQDGSIIASGGASDITCLVQDGEGNKQLAVKVVNIDGETVAKSKTSTQVLTDGNQLTNATLEQDGNVLASGGAKDLTCLIETETGKQTALKTVVLDGEIISGGATDTTCLVEDSNGIKQLALKSFSLGGGGNWKKPSDWSDIRKDCPTDSIALYVGCREEYDYTIFDNLGFTATCTGGYNVFIDGVQYGTTYASGAQCDITWSTSGIATGDDITTPSAMKAHKIWIEPATEGNNITVFRCKRVAASGTEQQGILWAHFNIDYQLSSIPAFGDETNQFRNTLLRSVTAKDNKLRISNLYYAFYNCNSLEYIPEFILPSSFSYYLSGAFAGTNIKKITLKDTSFTNIRQSFQNCQNLKKITLKNVDLSGLTNANNFITNAKSLEDTVLDVSNATGLTKIGCYGDSSNFIAGFKGLRVSDQAPFSGTAPQINVSYTGMDRQALVTLFNDLPTVSSGQIINITGCTGSESLSAEEVAIATDKGWTVTGGPAYEVFATYSGASIDDTIKINDGMATSNYDWSAYPSDTAMSGSYTQTATVIAANANTLGIATKPSQDDKSITIKAGKMYYAYTNENDNTETLYATDNPVSIRDFNLENLTNYNCTNLGNSIYQGGSGKYLYTNSIFNTNDADSWEIYLCYTHNTNPNTWNTIVGQYQNDNSGFTLNVRSGGGLEVNLLAPSNSWLIADRSVNLTMVQGTTYYIIIGYDSSLSEGQYYFKYNTDGSDTYTTTWTYTSTTKNRQNEVFSMLGCKMDPTGRYNTGKLNLSKCKFILDGVETTFGYFSEPSTLYENIGTTEFTPEPLDPQPEFIKTSDGISIDSVDYDRNSGNDLIKQITSDIEIIDNTTIQSVSIISDQTATIETSANITTSNNDNVITDGSYKLFNLTIPAGMTAVIESNGMSCQTSDMPLLLKKNSGVGLLIKDGNNSYYRNSWVITRDYDLHYQQINFSYPSGSTVTCKVNNVEQSNLMPYAYDGDIISWTCDNSGTVTTGTYTVKYSSKDSNIQTITIS